MVVVDDEEEEPEEEPVEEDPEAEGEEDVLNRLSTTPEVAEPETEEVILNPLLNDYVSSKNTSKRKRANGVPRPVRNLPF